LRALAVYFGFAGDGIEKKFYVLSDGRRRAP
jgi:hypothetical protein